MAIEPIKQTVPTPASTPALDWAKATQHLNTVKTSIMSYAGKADHNPYMMLRQLGIPIMEKLLEKKTYSPDLYEKIMKLDVNTVPSLKNLEDSPEFLKAYDTYIVRKGD